MSAKPTPPCVRAKDADGSEFFLDARGLAWRADSSRVPELDGPAVGMCAGCGCRGYHVDTTAGEVIGPDGACTRVAPRGSRLLMVDERGELQCDDCAALATNPDAAPTPAPLDRSEVVRALASELVEAGSKVTGLGRKVDALRYNGKRLVIESIAYRLGLRAEFDAACKEVKP